MTTITNCTIGFPFFDDIDHPPIRLTGVGVEDRTNSDYHFENSRRNICSYLFQYTLEGSGILEIDGNKKIIDKGKAFFIKIPSDTTYYFNSDDTNWRFIFVLFMGNDMEKYYNYIVSKLGNVFEIDAQNNVIMAAVNLFVNAKDGKLSDSFLTSGYAFDFVCKLCSYCNSFSLINSRVQQIMEYISENCTSIISTSDIAKYFNISQSYLSRLFKKYTDTSPIDYLTRARINHSIEMLMSASLTIDEIATSSGFENGNYYCKVFKKNIGITPSEYRNLSSNFNPNK